jgi:CubicO group peptidase (beta-lactamase class C family)
MKLITRSPKSNILNLLEQANVPGVSISLVENENITWSEAVGVKNLITRDPVDVNTVFEGASLAKTLFAYAVLKFFKKEKLSIDVPLSNYYPESYTEWGFSSDNPNLKFVTLRHILSHTSGFSNWDCLNESEVRQLKFIPGERFFYSGEGYIYLQRVLEFLSGQPLAEYMLKNIFIPFNMHNSSYIWLDKFSDNIASGHGKRNEGLGAHWSKGFSAYSLYSTPSDLANFLIEIIMANQGDEFRLSLSDIHLMMSPQINITPFCSWGLGLGLEHTSHGNYFWQWGSAGDFQSFILGSIEQHWGVVVMTNSEHGLEVCENLVHEITGKKHPCASIEFLTQISLL